MTAKRGELDASSGKLADLVASLVAAAIVKERSAISDFLRTNTAWLRDDIATEVRSMADAIDRGEHQPKKERTP